MRETADAQLLHDYAECGSESAFRELVTRHTDFVYSAALRQVGSSALAADIAQNVFVDLARKAKHVSQRFKRESSLAGWLHRGTRYAALNAIRNARRREANERQAMTQLITDAEAATNWEAIRPTLDEALDNLGDRDRDAILLRYFENKDFRTVGAALGVSDDAAQKRVSRAVERLREFFAQRGVTVGASGLAVVISANAVQAAPTGLAIAISTAVLAGTTLGSTATVGVTNAIAMTTFQKTLVTVAIVLVGAEIYTIRHASRLRGQIESLERQNAEQIQQLTRERDEARQRLTEASGQPLPNLPAPRVRVATPPPDEPAATGLIARILEGEEVPRLTAEQTARYLEENHRDAASLLAAYRTSGDSSHLKEAMERFPDEPQVGFEAVFARDTSLAERRRWLDAFKQAAPENALANYLSALDYFKADRTDQAVEELIMASGKEGFHDFTRDRIQANEEAYRSAGYTEADTRTAATWGLLMPQLSELRKLGASVVELAAAYRQTGDNASAQAALEMAIRLGERFDGPTGKESLPLVSRMSGLIIEQVALKAMDPDHTFGAGTVKERLDQLAGQQQAIGDLVKHAKPYHGTMTPQDWINYNDRFLMFGEEQAMRWLLKKYSQDGLK